MVPPAMLDFTDEMKLAQKAIRGWCAQHLEPKVAALESNEITPFPLIREMVAAFGIPDMVRAGLEKAKAHAGGGTGTGAGSGDSGAAMTAILMMELSRVCPGFAMAFGGSVGLYGGAVMAKGTLEQKEKWGLPAQTFEKIGAWALTEPGAGSDAFGSMKTRARRAEGGYRLSGQKTFITNAPFADVFVIYARLLGDGDAPGSEGAVRAFLVSRDTKGLTCGAPMKKMGMHTSPTGEIFLDDVFVPTDQVLGGERPGASDGDAKKAARESLKGERFGMTPMCLGIVDRCLEESVRYAREREQWGKPIASFQLVQAMIARIYAARSIMFTLLMRQLEADAKGVSLPLEEASAAKLYCARMATECALEAVQLKGGAGYMQGSVVEMLARDAKLFQIGGGTDEIQMLRIAREVLSV
jgi:alkylation response protein AidB-like acyl-CoA dehydrogenase